MSEPAEERIIHPVIVEIGQLSFCICNNNGNDSGSSKGCRLGRGSYGIVCKGKLKIDVEDEVAVKEMDVAVKRVDRLNTKIEEEILRLVNGHPNVLLYYTTERKADYL